MFNKIKEEVIKDYGQITIPESWEEVSLFKFQEIMKYNDNPNKDIRELLSILTDKDKDYINQLPAEIVESLLARLVFLNEDPKFGEATNIIKVGKEEYVVNHLEKLKFGEYVDVNSTMDADKYNYAAFIAILCRKRDEKYDDEFIAEKLENRIKMFGELPITEVMPLVSFFLQLGNLSQVYSQDYLTEAKSTLNQLLSDIQNSVKHGEAKKSSLIWRMKTLMKLKKYKKLISQLS